MDLKARVLEGELMDAPELEPARHHQALKGLERVNRFSGTAAVLCHAIADSLSKSTMQAVDESSATSGSSASVAAKIVEPAAARPTLRRPARILDLACGGGDVTRAVYQYLTARGIGAEVEGWDRSPTAIEYARQRCANDHCISFRQCDVSDLDGRAGDFDIVMCTLFLHHLDRDQARHLLGAMVRAARRMVLIDDLRRTWLGYRLAQLGCQLLTRSPIVHVDGPLSVRAAFNEKEVEQLCIESGIPQPRIRRHWPQRFLLRWDLGP